MGISGWNCIRCFLTALFFMIVLPGLVSADTDTMSGNMDSGKSVAVITHTWGGGDDTSEIIFMTRQGSSYAISDLEGTWRANKIVSGPDAPYWMRAVATVAADGSFHAEQNDSDGGSDPVDSSFLIDFNGIVTLSSGDADTQCHMDAQKTVVVCTATWDGSATTELGILTKQASSYANSDVTGSWKYHSLLSPGPYWQRGTITITASGNWTVTGENSDGESGLSESGSGATFDTATGIMTLTPPGRGTVECHLAAGKTFAACTQTPQAGNAGLMIMTRRAASYSQSDLAGSWHSNALASPGPFWDRGTIKADAVGGFSTSGADNAGEPTVHSGVMTLNSMGVLTLRIDSFTASPTAGPAPLTVSFSDMSVHNATSWLWDFGDGSTSRLKNPVHTYTIPGVYTVSLTVAASNGPVTITEVDYISAGAATAVLKLPDSGQIKCYNTAGNEIPCNGTGQDGAYTINPMSYTDNLDGTITDNNTGLMWQKQDDQQPRNWYQASGTYHATHNPSTVNVCSSSATGGYSDWRLPSRMELLTITDQGVSVPGPTINSLYFPNTMPYGDWTSTEVAAVPGKAWQVSFYNGGIFSGDKSAGNGFVRCVRGVQTDFGSFVDNGDGTVTNIATGLMWQKGEGGAMTWNAAISYCEGRNLAGHTDWRLPNFKELQSLVDPTRTHPAINKMYFPNTKGTTQDGEYWSSTTYDFSEDGVWSVDFYDGKNYGDGKLGAIATRCVRGGYTGAMAKLTATAQGSGSGKITADAAGLKLNYPALLNTAIGLDAGSVVTLTATAAAGSSAGWSGDCDSVGGTAASATCSINMNAGKTATAEFTKLTLLSPNGGEVLASGAAGEMIEWEAPAHAANFKLQYSVDNGVTWQPVVCTAMAGSGCEWTIPPQARNRKNCRIKVVAFDSNSVKIGSDISDAPFSIGVVRLTSPNGGESWSSGITYPITWTTNATIRPVASAVLWYSKDGGVTWLKAGTESTAPLTNSTWLVPAVAKPKTNCRIKVDLKDSLGNSLGSDVSDAVFTINPN